jgi:hypothetical protein
VLLKSNIMEEEISIKNKRTAALSRIIKFPLRIITLIGKGKKEVLIIVIVLITAVSGTIYLARTRPELLGINTTNESTDEVSEVERLVTEVGQIIALPDELPTVATVTDAELTKEQPFFANAQNGDRVLIYSSAKKAYLYRPSEKRIIEVGVVNIDQQEANQEGEETENIILDEVTPSPELTEELDSLPLVIPTSQETPTPTIQ